MQAAFHIGQIVVLSSNPECAMTVTELLENGEVKCIWMDKNNTLRWAEFPPVLLTEKTNINKIGFVFPPAPNCFTEKRWL
jgi:uncharacterized protein YodC (DUF2158 family)